MILNCIKCGHLYLAHEEPGGCMAAGDCNCTLDKVAVLLGCIAALEAENAKLRATLEEAREIINKIMPYTMLSYPSLITLYQQAKWCELNLLPGNFVECGVWKGGAVGLMAQVNLLFNKNYRHIHCFDIFLRFANLTQQLMAAC